MLCEIVGLGFVGRTQADDHEREKYLVLVTAIRGAYHRKREIWNCVISGILLRSPRN